MTMHPLVLFLDVLGWLTAGQIILFLFFFSAKLSVDFVWFDLWVGWYWDRQNRRLYWCPLPTQVFRFDFPK